MSLLWDFTYILRNLVLDLPSVVLNGNDFLCFLPSHEFSDLKVSKLCPLLKQHAEHLVENSRKNSKIFKKNIGIGF